MNAKLNWRLISRLQNRMVSLVFIYTMWCYYLQERVIQTGFSDPAIYVAARSASNVFAAVFR